MLILKQGCHWNSFATFDIQYVVLNTDDIRISPCISKSATCGRLYDQ